MLIRCLVVGLVFIGLARPLQAGLYYSGESVNELPASWRGFLLDHRALLMIGSRNGPPTLLREQYQHAFEKLVHAAKTRALSADEMVDLGALSIRLGDAAKAIEVLRAGARQFPDDFRIHANLGTAWLAQGEHGNALVALQEAVRLAPPRWKAYEEAHLRLIQLRQREGKMPSGLDDLFGVRFVGANGKFEPGKIEPEQRKKLPANDVALVQQLALWMPGDPRLLWLLGELANAHGDVRTAAALLDGCVSEFALGFPELKDRRAIYREAADAISRLPDEEHAKYRGDLVWKSTRALVRQLDASLLPPIRASGTNTLPWLVLSETTIRKPFKPTFHKYLEDLDGKSITMTGFMQATVAENEFNSFLLLEYPIGCWFCETPEIAAMVFVELADGKTTTTQRGKRKVTGILKLNRNDPERFLYTITDAKVSELD